MRCGLRRTSLNDSASNLREGRATTSLVIWVFNGSACNNLRLVFWVNDRTFWLLILLILLSKGIRLYFDLSRARRRLRFYTLRYLLDSCNYLRIRITATTYAFRLFCIGTYDNLFRGFILLHLIHLSKTSFHLGCLLSCRFGYLFSRFHSSLGIFCCVFGSTFVSFLGTTCI